MGLGAWGLWKVFWKNEHRTSSIELGKEKEIKRASGRLESYFEPLTMPLAIYELLLDFRDSSPLLGQCGDIGFAFLLFHKV